MGIKISSIKAVYGETYKKGYIGFTYYNTSIVSIGIAYMTHWARMSDIKVSHTLIVTGENECIEAQIEDGVVRSDLDRYFNNPSCQIFFRKPIGLTDDIATNLVKSAEAQLGTKYDINLIVAAAMQGAFIGKLINTIFSGKPDRLVSKRLNREDRWICSELVAYCLNEQSQYSNQGVLENRVETIDPQELFEDQSIFEPWAGKVDDSVQN